MQFLRTINVKNLTSTVIMHIVKKCQCFIGAHGGAVRWGTALQAGRSQVWFPMVSLEFIIDVILPAALWPWGRISL